MKKYLQSICKTVYVTLSLYRILQPLKILLLTAFFLSLTSGVVYSVVIAEAFRRIVDSAQGVIGNDFIFLILFYLIIVVIISLIWGGCDCYINYRTKAKASILLREKMLYALLLSLKGSMDEQNTADIEKRYTQDINQTVQFLGRGLFSSIFCPLIEGFVCFILLVNIHPLLLLLSVVVGFISFYIQSKFLFSTSHLSDELTYKKGLLNAGIFDIIIDLPVIRLFCVAPIFEKRAYNINEEVYKIHIWILNIEIKQSTIDVLIKSTQDISMIIMGGLLINENIITYGMLLAAMKYSVSVIGIFSAVSGGITSVQGGRASAERVLEILNMEKYTQNENPLYIKEQESNPLISINNLSFSLRDNQILSSITLNIYKGEHIAFIGISGSGKTTLAQIIAGFYPQNNYIINNYKISGKIKTLNSICYISSTAYIFHDTLYNNIALYRNNIDRVAVNKALEQVSLKDWLQKLPDGLDTILTNNASNISGGEKQRISIARGLVAIFSLYIWDEPTSALDEPTRNLVRRLIHNMPIDTTQLLITHDYTLLDKMDRIFVIDKGKLIREITHDEYIRTKT